MTQLTNSFHDTSATITAKTGELVSAGIRRRVKRLLCPFQDCTCSRRDGTRNSRYYLEEDGYGNITVIDRDRL